MELFEFLAQHVAAKVIQDKELLTTYNDDVISALPFDKEGLGGGRHKNVAPCCTCFETGAFKDHD